MKIYWYEGKKNLIGPAVRLLRKEKGLSQEKLAQQLQLMGYDFNALTILRIEKGDRFVADYEVKAIADYFQIATDDLYSAK